MQSDVNTHQECCRSLCNVCQRVTAPAVVTVPELMTALQKTLDELIDRGDISSRDLDTRTMDALEGRWPLQSCCMRPLQVLVHVSTIV